VHHRTIQINHQPDATVFQFIILTFVCSSNMFRAFSRPSSGAQWLQWQPLVLPSYRGDSHAVVRGRAGRTDHEHSTTVWPDDWMTGFDSQQGKPRFYRDKRIYLFIYLFTVYYTIALGIWIIVLMWYIPLRLINKVTNKEHEDGLMCAETWSYNCVLKIWRSVWRLTTNNFIYTIRRQAYSIKLQVEDETQITYK
jgi:hypothetical protein